MTKIEKALVVVFLAPLVAFLVVIGWPTVLAMIYAMKKYGDTEEALLIAIASIVPSLAWCIGMVLLLGLAS